MQFIKNLFSASDKASMTRLCMFVTVVTACVIAVIAVLKNRDLSATGVLVGTMLVPSFGGLAANKKYETKNEEVKQ